MGWMLARKWMWKRCCLQAGSIPMWLHNCTQFVWELHVWTLILKRRSKSRISFGRADLLPILFHSPLHSSPLLWSDDCGHGDFQVCFDHYFYLFSLEWSVGEERLDWNVWGHSFAKWKQFICLLGFFSFLEMAHLYVIKLAATPIESVLKNDWRI